MTKVSARPTLGIVTFLLPIFAVGCAARPQAPTDAGRAQASAGELPGTSWRLEDLGGESALEGVETTLEFPEAGKVAGRASCNRFFGTVEISGQSIKFGPLAATKMSCGDAADTQERKYLGALQKAERFAVDGPALLIYSTGMERPLRFARK
jgi:heat shock protein HslJ